MERFINMAVINKDPIRDLRPCLELANQKALLCHWLFLRVKWSKKNLLEAFLWLRTLISLGDNIATWHNLWEKKYQNTPEMKVAEIILPKVSRLFQLSWWWVSFYAIEPGGRGDFCLPFSFFVYILLLVFLNIFSVVYRNLPCCLPPPPPPWGACTQYTILGYKNASEGHLW